MRSTLHALHSACRNAHTRKCLNARRPGARGRAPRRAPPPLLNAGGEDKLKKLFEGLAADKDNLERLTAGA